MKKLIVILAFLPLFCNAQDRSIGDELITAKSNWYKGLTFTALGSGIATFGIIQGNTELIIAGGAFQLMGFIFMIESWSHFGKAGRLMNEKKIGITFNNGIGLRYRI